VKTSKPPFIAAWLLDRFGADPQLDAIAGDLLEQYRLGHSRFWYWREVITAITVGTWAAFTDHMLVVLRAMVIGYGLTFMFARTVNPLWSSILAPLLENRYAFILVAAMELPLGLIWFAFVGWILAQCAPQCRIPAIVGFAISLLLVGLIININLMIHEGNSLELWLSMLAQPALLTIPILFGGGLLTGSPKRTISTH